MTTLYEVSEDGVRFASERRAGEVRIPNYVYDMWLPLLGATTIGVYSIYCRLEREGIIKGLKLKDVARLCRIGTRTLQQINDTLAQCNFIKVVVPQGQKRLMHWTTEIIVLDPPREVPKEAIDFCKPEGDYQLLTPWLVKPPEVSDENSGDPKRKPDESSSDASNVAPSSLQPSADALGTSVPPQPANAVADAPTLAQVALTNAEPGATNAPPPAPVNAQAWDIVNTETKEVLERLTNPILAKKRVKELNAVGGARYSSRLVKKPNKAWSALTTAMHEAIPDAIRPPKCHHGKNDKAAKVVFDAGFTPADVTAYVTWAYQNDPWLMSGGAGGAAIPVTMYYVETHIKPWKNGASNGHSPLSTPEIKHGKQDFAASAARYNAEYQAKYNSKPPRRAHDAG